jgi:signal transduction histidine kinase
VSGLRLVHFGTDAAFATAIRDVLAAQLPDCASEALDPENLKTRPVADAVIIDARDDLPRGAEFAARLRAMGFTGAIVVVSDAGIEPDAALAPMGAARITSRAIADQLIPRLAEQIALAGGEHAQQVMRARKLVAAGEIAGRFQHSLNNPLAGILAEAQLMQLDSLRPEQHAALERIVGLCRRIVELGRSLDGMGERK